MTYNLAGCVTSLNRTTNKVDISSLGWDCEYQLTNVVAGAATVRYTYDVAGRKASRSEGGVTERYLYDGIHVVADTDNSGSLLRTYTYGLGIDNILAMTIHGSGGTTNYYYLKDLANTVLALANSSGSIVESYVYDAYGNVTIRNGSGTMIPASAYGNRFLFQGREYDYTTQLYHFRARWYDPETGRWLSNDPIGISGGLNLYAFCSNDPVNFVDPTGLWWWDQGLVEWGAGGMLGFQGVEAGFAAWEAFGQSIKSSYLSVGDGLVSFFSGDTEALEDAYDCGVFGQSANEDPITKYGTRAAIGTASASVVTATALSWTGINPWVGTIGLHSPHHGMGYHFEIIIRKISGGNSKVIIPGKDRLIWWK